MSIRQALGFLTVNSGGSPNRAAGAIGFPTREKDMMSTSSLTLSRVLRKPWFWGSGVLSLCLLALLYFFWQGGFRPAGANGENSPIKAKGPYRVTTTQLKIATFERVTVQPGSVKADRSANLFARISGYLKEQRTEIGDWVKKGDMLAIIDVPDLEKQVNHQVALLEQTEAKVEQLKTRVQSAKAELDAAKAGVAQAEAATKAAAAWARYREKKMNRLKELVSSKFIQETLADEAQEQYEAAVETELSSKSAVLTAKAQVAAHASKVDQTNADVIEGKAAVKVARADLQKAQVMVSFGEVTAPFEGVITKRNFDPGEYLHSPSGGSGILPLFTIEKTDVVRVVVQIPDQHVPYANVGDTAFVEFDAFPGKKIEATISRVALSEDPKTRYMHVEIDLQNSDKKIVPGMYGRVTVILDQVIDHLSVPEDCLVQKVKNGKSSVFVEKKGKAFLTPVRLGLTNGTNWEIVDGLKSTDNVIEHPPPGLAHGKAVVIVTAH